MSDHRPAPETHVHVHLHDLLSPVVHWLERIFRNTERLIQMSGTLAEQLAAAQAETSAALDAIAVDVTEIGADVDTLLAGMTPGTTITPELVAAGNAIRDRVAGIKSGLDAVNAKVPNTPTT